MNPKLIITADDWGLSPEFNQGIIETARAGVTTGISIMIRRSFVDEDALLQIQNEKLALGLHLELEGNSPESEIFSQIEEFQKRLEQLPDYLDGHQHHHLSERFLSYTIAAAKQYDLPVRSRYPEDRITLQEAGIRTPDNFISWHPSRLSVLEERIETAKQFSLSELVVHPGYFDPNCDYPYNHKREMELSFLKSEKFQQLITDFQRIPYTEVK